MCYYVKYCTRKEIPGAWKISKVHSFPVKHSLMFRVFWPSSTSVARPLHYRRGPLQLAIQGVHNCHAGEQKWHWDKTNTGNYHLKLRMPFLPCPSATFALQQGGFVPPEWLAAKGLLSDSNIIKP